MSNYFLDDYYRITNKGVELNIYAFPNSKNNKIDKKVYIDTEGNKYLKVRVSAIPEEGKANKALIKLIASEFGISKNKVSLLFGEKNNKKIILLREKYSDVKFENIQKATIK